MLLTTTALPLDLAKKIADAAEAKAIELNLKIVVAIMDNHGNLKYYRRMDGNNLVSVEMAPLKALTSARIPISTKALAERSVGLTANPYIGVPDLVLLEGGLPLLTKAGEHIGAIGVSGATPELDGICAQAGLDLFNKLIA